MSGCGTIRPSGWRRALADVVRALPALQDPAALAVQGEALQQVSMQGVQVRAAGAAGAAGAARQDFVKPSNKPETDWGRFGRQGQDRSERTRQHRIPASSKEEPAGAAGRGKLSAAPTGKAVAGCHTLSLGSLRYVAVATPDFRDRHFPDGVTAARLAEAPVLRFSPRDRLQLQWTVKIAGSLIEGPTHWVPSTQGFLDFTLAGVAWSLTPERLAAPLIASGRLVDLAPGVIVDVPLFWQHLRITTRLIEDLTSAVRAGAVDWLHLA